MQHGLGQARRNFLYAVFVIYFPYPGLHGQNLEVLENRRATLAPIYQLDLCVRKK